MPRTIGVATCCDEDDVADDDDGDDDDDGHENMVKIYGVLRVTRLSSKEITEISIHSGQQKWL